MLVTTAVVIVSDNAPDRHAAVGRFYPYLPQRVWLLLEATTKNCSSSNSLSMYSY